MSTSENIAFVCPRFADAGTVGGAETLLRNLAERLAAHGRRVSFLVTCAKNHFTWVNELPAGCRQIGNLEVHFFPVDAERRADLFLRAQAMISRGRQVSRDIEEVWVRHSVNSRALCAYLRTHTERYDRIVIGPYPFGLTYHAAQVSPEKTLLVPCLHDEPFARLSIMHELFRSVAGLLFNTEPERELAERLYSPRPVVCQIVGMGLDPFQADAHAFARRRGLTRPYVIYSGRREAAKGIPLLTAYLHAFRMRTGRDIDLVITGSGPIEAPPALWDHIIDTGFLPNQEKWEAMAGAVAFIHPSTLESLGIVLLEAFMARTPALVHAGSSVLQWQCRRSGGGLWFRNYPEFEEELSLLLNDESLRRQMGQQGREFVLREYAWDRVEQRLFAALDTPLA